MHYTHLTQDERCQIFFFRQRGLSDRGIGRELGRSNSRISRELKQNQGLRCYRPKAAQKIADRRWMSATKHLKLNEPLIDKIEEMLCRDWSPEQISGRLKKCNESCVSHETIYRHILKDKKTGGELYRHLRCQKKRKKRYGTKSHDRRGQIKNRIGIEKRPLIVEKKLRYGDWEGDLVIGKNHKGSLVTLVDRKTKKTRIIKVSSKRAREVAGGIIKCLKNDIVHTITLDNGKEFSAHPFCAPISLNLDNSLTRSTPYALSVKHRLRP